MRFNKRSCSKRITGNAPREFVEHARDPASSVRIGGNFLVTVPIYGPSLLAATDINRRYGTLDDFMNRRTNQTYPFLALASFDGLPNVIQKQADPVRLKSPIRVNGKNTHVGQAGVEYDQQQLLVAHLILGDDFWQQPDAQAPHQGIPIGLGLVHNQSPGLAEFSHTRLGQQWPTVAETSPTKSKPGMTVKVFNEFRSAVPP